jgi:type II secretory pathway component GspD/PulD (secretin)
VRERVLRTTQKVPFLGSLPYLGYLFGAETNSTLKSVVLVVLTPEVVKQPSNLKANDQTLVSQAKGEQTIPLPVTSAGFDQYLLDKKD